MRVQKVESEKKSSLLRTKGKELPEILSLSEASALVPSRPSIPTVHRWMAQGVNGHRLPSVKVGGKRMVFLSDLENFLLALNDREPANAEIISDSSDLVSHLLGQRKTAPCTN